LGEGLHFSSILDKEITSLNVTGSLSTFEEPGTVPGMKIYDVAIFLGQPTVHILITKPEGESPVHSKKSYHIYKR